LAGWVISFLPFVRDSPSFNLPDIWTHETHDEGFSSLFLLHQEVFLIVYFLSHPFTSTFIWYFSLLHLYLESFLNFYFHSHHSTSYYYDGHGFTWGVRWKYQTFVTPKNVHFLFFLVIYIGDVGDNWILIAIVTHVLQDPEICSVYIYKLFPTPRE
jgi:hypothetical protein